MVIKENNETENEEVKRYPFDPDWAIHPGISLAEQIACIWAEEKGLDPLEICDIVNGFKPITPELAKKFAKLLGVSETFWNNLQRNYEKLLSKIEDNRSDGKKDHIEYAREMRRLTQALSRIVKVEFISEWLLLPNEAFDDLTPMEIIYRGEIDRIWQMIFELESGMPV